MSSCIPWTRLVETRSSLRICLLATTTASSWAWTVTNLAPHLLDSAPKIPRKTSLVNLRESSRSLSSDLTPTKLGITFVEIFAVARPSTPSHRPKTCIRPSGALNPLKDLIGQRNSRISTFSKGVDSIRRLRILRSWVLSINQYPKRCLDLLLWESRPQPSWWTLLSRLQFRLLKRSQTGAIDQPKRERRRSPNHSSLQISRIWRT